MPLRALPAPWAAPLIAGPADDVTRDRPAEALEVIDDAAANPRYVVGFAAA